ncbi:protein-tyrosine phosphatase [Palleronia salina]|uniref:protein-tyrosine-phosphatase n=1 Tax=Palleronia salina TaxID=313368 RepID=A0A1M6HJN1_9RHOB|nr:low molecular weight protein-tyrosine-phosphatase [Palleronia salina]SHJ22446.1 protein-tyrosine phosphatase [Palleronia salina]
MTRILIVCLGNICRSPTAEAVLRAKLDAAGIAGQVDSAGTGDWHVGDPPHPPMIRAAAKAGYDLTPLRARQFTPADFDAFDLILAADPANLRDIEAQRPAGHATPVRLLAPYAETGTEEVPDPYYTKDFDGALRLIERACDGVVAQLQ